MSSPFSPALYQVYCPLRYSLLRYCLLLCALSFAPLPQRGLAQVPSTHRLGTNLDGVVDYSPQLPFTDLFLISREWLTQCTAGVDPGCTAQNAFDTGEGAQLDLDQHGWVRSLPSSGPRIYRSVATFWDIAPTFPMGRYVVRYQGSGSIQYQLGAQKISAESQPGRDVITVNPAAGGILLRITATDPGRNGDYLRNIRLVAESDESRLSVSRFSRRFLERLEPYQVLRFMDWMRTNNSELSSWGGRPRATDARYSTSRGVPLEVMVDLANTSSKVPWFTIPHQADDTYIQNFAAQTRATLNATLPVYVEYSNEVWNSVFTQGGWVEEQAEAEWPGGGESGFTKRLNWYGKRAAEVCDLWRTAFGTQSSRVLCVIASQAANSYTASESLSCPLWDQAPCSSHGIRALAIAPYFGDYLGQEDNFGEVLGWTNDSDGGSDRLFSELAEGGELTSGPAGGALAESARWITENLAVARSRNLPLVTYEGGQHLVGIGSAGQSAAIEQLFTSANRSSRIGTLYGRYLARWRELGGSLFTHFTDIGLYTRFGSWGALEESLQSESPKYTALVEFSGSSASVMVRVSRKGAGTVRSSPAGISCGGACSRRFTRGSTVVLTATPANGSRFRRWSGACRHSRRRCQVTLTSAQGATAHFIRRGR